jgi:hypothetical protein
MVGTSQSGHNSKEHGLLLFLAPELQLALAQLQVNQQLSRARAGLLALTEGFYKCGCIKKEAYEALKNRYSEKITCSIVAEHAKPRTVQEVQEQTRLRKLEVEFSRVISQWSSMSTKNRNSWLKEAEEYKDRVPNAKLVLALATENNGPVKQETLTGMT